MQYNESFFLPIFLRHYSQYFDSKNIFVIDHGSDQNLIPPEFNRIYIPRDKPFSEVDRLALIKDVSNGLLRYYDVGIFADTDELIYLNNFNYGALKETSPIYVAGFDSTIVEINGRKKLVGIPVPFLYKALIFNKVPDWSPGFHSIINVKPPEFFNIPMVHLKYLSELENNIRNINRASTYEKMDGNEKAYGLALHWRDNSQDRFNFNKVIADSIEISSIKSFSPIESAPYFYKKSLEGYAETQPTDFIYLAQSLSWDASKITDLTEYFPHIIDNY